MTAYDITLFMHYHSYIWQYHRHCRHIMQMDSG